MPYVGDALAMLMTADNALEAQGDTAVMQERLGAYWATTPRRSGPPCRSNAGPAFRQAAANQCSA